MNDTRKILVSLPEGVHNALRVGAENDNRPLNAYARGILVDYATGKLSARVLPVSSPCPMPVLPVSPVSSPTATEVLPVSSPARPVLRPSDIPASVAEALVYIRPTGAKYDSEDEWSKPGWPLMSKLERDNYELYGSDLRNPL